MAADTLANSIRTSVPLKLAQRSSSSRVDDLSLQDLRLYNRALTARRSRAARRRPRVPRTWSPSRPKDAAPAKSKSYYGWWLDAVDANYQQLAARKNELSAKRRRSNRGHDRPRVAGKSRRLGDGVHLVSWRLRQAARRSEGRHARYSAAVARRIAAQSAGLRPLALAARASADGARDGQSLLAGSLRHGPGEDGRRVRRGAASCRRIPSCSIGWRSSSAITAGTSSGCSAIWSRRPRTGRSAAVDARKAAKTIRKTGCWRAARGSAWMPKWSATTPWRPAVCWCASWAGRACKPYQPDGVWEAVAMIGSNTRDYKHDTGDKLVSPQPVHVLEAGRPAGLDGHLQRAQPRDLHGPPRADQHAAAGAGDLERPAVRRGGPPPGRAGPARRGRCRRRTASTTWPRRILARPFTDEERSLVEKSLATLA